MKKLICLLLCIVLVTASFSGCKAEEEQVTLTVLVEEAYLPDSGDVPLAETVAWKYPNITLEFITLPMDEMERMTALQNMRTEIMSGKGPDIFLLSTWNQNSMTYDEGGRDIPRVEPLFKSVEDSMANGVFLDLDEYIEKSKYIDMDNHISAIVDAGKTDRGQMLLPLHYTVPMILADKSKLADPDMTIDSIDSITESGDEDLLFTLRYEMENWFAYFFTGYEDHNNNNLTLTEEELHQAFEYAEKMFEAPELGEFIAYDCEDNSFSQVFDEMLLYQWMRHYEEVVPIIMPNMEGGVTALIETFVAINGGTEHPEEAFKVIELFYSDEIQKKGCFYTGEKTDNGVDIKKNISTEIYFFNKFTGVLTGKAAFSDDGMFDADLVDYLNSRITHVRFTSEFDCLLTDAWKTLENDYYFQRGDRSIDYDTQAYNLYSELYSDFKMMAAE